MAYLLVWIDVDVAFDALLPHVGPGVAAHPLPLTLGALVLSKASLLALVGGQSFTFRPCLGREIIKTTNPFKRTSRAGVQGVPAAVILMYLHAAAALA